MIRAMIEREDQLKGRRLAADERIRFRCRPGLTCFNSCCRAKRLPLFPYDLLRLRRALVLPSDELLATHVELELDPDSGWPLLRIKLAGDGRCPFVGERGCQVYAHRPACCRIFPLSRAVAPSPTGPPHELFHAMEQESCLGWQEPRELTVEQFLEEQELGPYRLANNRILDLLFHPRRPCSFRPDERQTHAIIMALHNLDVWRQAVADPGFARRFGIPLARIERALATDEALLELGQEWLAALLFG